jgi:hypothetical protein
MHVVELADRMNVRIDAEYAALIECLLMPAPVDDAVFRTRFEDFVDVEIITGVAWQLTVRMQSFRSGLALYWVFLTLCGAAAACVLSAVRDLLCRTLRA